jgi:hypothetical protein
MAKCVLCDHRKGKRNCALKSGLVCSLCCGETRRKEQCEGCQYFREVKAARRYGDVPRFSTAEMDRSVSLQSHADTIEATLCSWDQSHRRRLSDASAISVLEMLLNKHHFGDPDTGSTDPLLREGFEMVDQVIDQDLCDVSRDTLVKVLGVLHYVAKRRSEGRREYLEIIHQYVGVRVAPGTRLLTQ